MYISTLGENGSQQRDSQYNSLQTVEILPLEKLTILKMQIRHALNELVELERQEAAVIERQYQQKDDSEKAAAYVAAGARGLFNAAKDTALWIKEVYDLVSPDARRQRIFNAIIDARKSNSAFLPALKHSYLAAEKREFIEVIGFDPAAISEEQYNQAALAASLIWEDPILRSDITRFAKNYTEAQHSLEITEIGGGAAFEIVLTLVLAVFTVGAGVAVSVASKVRHTGKFKKVGRLLLQYAKSTHAHSLKKTSTKVEYKLPNFADFEVIDNPGRVGTSEPPKGPVTRKDKEASAPVVKEVKEQYGTNTATWKVDESGRPISVEAKLDSTYGTKRSGEEKKLQGNTGGNFRLDDDDGGHLVAHRFMSDQGEKNLFPQNSNLNRSAYKRMENEWGDWTAEGFEVKLKVNLVPPGSERPTDIVSKYEVIDPNTGDIVFKKRHRFNNKSGESFERVKKSDMNSYR